MKWDGDPYKELKRKIWENLRTGIQEKHAEKLTTKQVFEAIDEMIYKLTSISND